MSFRIWLSRSTSVTTTTSHCLCPLTLHSDSNIRVLMSTGSKTTSITSTPCWNHTQSCSCHDLQDYWTIFYKNITDFTNNNGLADFTNHNFVSIGTNFL